MPGEWMDNLWAFPLLAGVGFAIVVHTVHLVGLPMPKWLVKANMAVLACVSVGLAMVIAAARYWKTDPAAGFYGFSGFVLLGIAAWLWARQ